MPSVEGKERWVGRFVAGKPVEALHPTNVVLAYDQRSSATLNVRIKGLEYLQRLFRNFLEEGWLEDGITKAKEKLALQ